MLRLFLLFASLLNHPFHISVCDIVFNEKKNSIEISQRVFLDDFQEAMEKFHTRKLNFDSIYDTLQMDSLIKKYISNYFAIEVDGNRMDYIYIGHELDKQTLLFYLEITNVRTFNKIFLQNTILFNRYSDQSNLIHIKKGKKIKSQRINSEKQIANFNFK